MSPAPTRSVAPASRAKGLPTSSRSRSKPRSACGLDVFGTDYPTSDGTCIRDYIHVSDLVAAHRDALAYLRAGDASTTLNCGYGRGFSVLEVIDTIKRVSGIDFKVGFTDRRPGDTAEVVAACDRIRSTLKWRPRFNDLETIVSHALAWERKLSQRTG